MENYEMIPVRSVGRLLEWRVAAWQARRAIAELHTTSSYGANKIAVAIDETINKKLDSQEKSWVDKIERVRGKLNADSTVVSLIDYGAGSPELKRTVEEMYEGVSATGTVSYFCSASKPQFWATLLFKLVRQWKPLTAVELGTCLGISAAYQAAAQKVNDQGKLITMEGAESLACIAEENLQGLGLDNVMLVRGRFQDKLETVFRINRPIDYAFIDGHHDEQATVSYFESFIPHLSKNALVVLDDISWSEGMRKAWKKIIKNDRVMFSVDLRKIGICVVNGDLI